MTNLRRALHRFHPDVYRYLIASSLVGFSYFGFVTVLLNLYLLRLGYGTEFIGLVNGSTALAFALSSLPAGALGSRIGMRRGVMAGMGFLAAGVMLVPLVGLFPAGSTRDYSIIAMRLLSGIGFSLYMVNSYPYLVAATEARDRPYAFAMLAAIPPVAGFAGSIVSGALPAWLAAGLGLEIADPLPFALILVVAGAILLPNPWIVARTRDLEPPRRRRNGSARRRTREERSADGAIYLLIFFLGITAMLRMSGEGAARSFFNVYLEQDLGASTSRIGLLLAFGQLAAGPAALCAPALSARVGRVPMIVVTHRDHRLQPGDHGRGAALGGGGHRLHPGSRPALPHPVGVQRREPGDRSGELARDHVGRSVDVDGAGVHLDVARRRLPDSGAGIPRPLPAGGADHRGERARLLALLPGAAGRVPAAVRRSGRCRFEPAVIKETGAEARIA